MRFLAAPTVVKLHCSLKKRDEYGNIYIYYSPFCRYSHTLKLYKQIQHIVIFALVICILSFSLVVDVCCGVKITPKGVVKECVKTRGYNLTKLKIGPAY